MIGGHEPVLLFSAAGIALFGVLLLAWFAFSSPRPALISCFAIVLAAGTKLRVRAPSASLEGTADAQILLELALYGVMAVIVGTCYLGRTGRLTKIGPAELLLLGYVSLALVSAGWSSVPTFTAVRALQLVILYGVAVTSVRILGPECAVRMASASVVLYVLLCCAAVVLKVPGAGEFARTDYFGFTRFTWFAVHPVSAGTYAAFAILSVVVAAFSSSRGWRDRRFGLPLWLCLGPLIAALVLTLSRGPLLAMLAATGLLTLKKMRFSNFIVLAATATLVIVTTFGAAPSLLRDSDHPAARAFFRGQNVDQVTGLSGRVALWERALPLFFERPIVGSGYHGSRPLLLRYAGWAGYAHNAFLQTLLDLGIVGAFLLWPPIAWAVLTSMTSRRRRGALLTRELAFVLATGVFLVINAVTSESFAGTPGFDILMLFLCTTVVSHVPTQAVHVLTRPVSPRPLGHPPATTMRSASRGLPASRGSTDRRRKWA